MTRNLGLGHIGLSGVAGLMAIAGIVLVLSQCEAEAQTYNGQGRGYQGRALTIYQGVPTVPGIERGRRFDRYYDARQGRTVYRHGAAVYDVDAADRPAPCGLRFEVLSGGGKGCI